MYHYTALRIMRLVAVGVKVSELFPVSHPCAQSKRISHVEGRTMNENHAIGSNAASDRGSCLTLAKAAAVKDTNKCMS